MVCKAKFKYVAALLALVILAALTLCACDKLPIKSIELNYSNESAYTVSSEGEIFSLAGLRIDVEWVNGGVVINSDPAIDTVRFHEVGEGEVLYSDNTMRYMLDGNTLRIKYAKSGKLKIGELQKYLYVSVPADMWLSDIDVKTVSGSVIIENVSANNVDCDTVSGAVSIYCTAGSVEVDGISANVSIGGNILEAEVGTVSGLTTVDCSPSLHTLEIDSTGGDIMLRIREDSGFTLDFQTVSGLFINAFKNETVNQGGLYIYKSGNNRYYVETVSGKLTIEKLL